MTDVHVTSDADEGTCSLDECTAASGGPCARGETDRLDCELYELTASDEAAEPEPEIRTLRLPSGEAPFAAEMEPLFAAHPASIVAPLGLNEAGKTTLIAMIYHLLRSRRLCEWRFAGSKTVIGLARRAHDASFASRRETGTTPRTGREVSGQHLHLAMRRKEDNTLKPLVLVDLAGEHVRELLNGTVPVQVAEALRRADHVPIVIDGAQVVDPKTRAACVVSTRTLLAMLDKQPRKSGTKLSVVLTKADLLVGLDTDDVLNAICRETIAEGAPRFLTADREEEALNGRNPVITLGTGVEAFVSSLVAPDPHSARSENASRVQLPAPSLHLQRLWSING